MFLFPPLIFAQVEARKAELLSEIREMLSASAKLQPTKVNIACHFSFTCFAQGDGGSRSGEDQHSENIEPKVPPPNIFYTPTSKPSFLLVMLFLQDGVADAEEQTDEGMLKEEKSTCQKRYDADSKVLSTTGQHKRIRSDKIDDMCCRHFPPGGISTAKAKETDTKRCTECQSKLFYTTYFTSRHC